MRQNPNPDEKLKNIAMFLCLANRLTRQGVIGDGLKVQKCTFLVTLDEFRNQLKGFNLTFFRYTWGPYSKQLWELRDRLISAGLLTEEKPVEAETGGVYALTKPGRALSDDLCKDIASDQRNAPFVESIENVANQFAEQDTNSIIKHVYGLEVQRLDGVVQRIEDMPQKVDITRVLDSAEARAEVIIPDSWLETIALATSPTSRKGMDRAGADLANGRVYPHSEVWA
jgi:uncharacterized protein YwgA